MEKPVFDKIATKIGFDCTNLINEYLKDLIIWELIEKCNKEIFKIIKGGFIHCTIDIFEKNVTFKSYYRLPRMEFITIFQKVITYPIYIGNSMTLTIDSECGHFLTFSDSEYDFVKSGLNKEFKVKHKKHDKFYPCTCFETFAHNLFKKYGFEGVTTFKEVYLNNEILLSLGNLINLINEDN